MFTAKKKVLLIIMDGLAAAPKDKGNAVTLANPSNLIKLWDTYPHTYLKASSEAVGLPSKTYGNSEVGHLNIGAGRVVYQNLPKINNSIQKGTYFENSTLNEVLDHITNFNSSLHIMGCLSDGSIHAHINHFIATLKFFGTKNFRGNIYFHCFTDGRDSEPKSAQKYLKQLQDAIDPLGIGQIASIYGRALAMDRNQTWDRTKKAYDMLTQGIAKKYSSWQEALNAAYSENQTDEYIEPRLIIKNNATPIINENDAVIFMNFRSDRALQLSEALIDPSFSSFEARKYNNLFFVGMVEYKKGFPKKVISPKEYINLSLGRILSEDGLRQLRIAESEKFPHVTYFFNGGVSLKYNGEDRIEIPSPAVPTYDLKPEMSALEVLEALSQRIALDIYNLIVLNLANGDMVGHTGNLEAAVKAVQVVDYVVDRLTKQFVASGGTVVITADHGNVEEVINLKSGLPDTEHSLNPVPFIVVNEDLPKETLPYGSLCDISPTILDLMGVPKPSEMQGKSLIN